VPFTSVIIGHETKTGDGTVAGSRVMWAEPDTLLFLREGPTKKERVLKTKKNRNDKEYEISYSVNWGEDRSGRDAFWINDDREVGGDGETIAPQAPKHSPILKRHRIFDYNGTVGQCGWRGSRLPCAKLRKDLNCL